MGFVDAVQNCLNNYTNGNGRAMRSEFWYWLLFNLLLQLVANILVRLTGWDIFSLAASLAVLCPTVAVGVRRLHDIGLSGWYYLIFFIPVVGFIMMIVWGVREGQPGPNQYGPDPRGGNFGGPMY